MTNQKNTAEQHNLDLSVHKKKIRPLSDLNLIDDYMFDVATLDLETCKSIIELSLNIQIREIEWKENQKVVHNLPGKRGIRLDFYVKDVQGCVFNVEMQKKNTGNLPKRTRYYAALLDAPVLKQGEHSFEALPPTYIIVICGFDCFGQGKYRYTFQNCCKEDKQLVLGNELTTVFLNTKGTNEEEVEPALVAFLHFIENSTAEEARQSSDPRIQNMYEKINDLKSYADVEADYMTAEEYRRMIEEEARESGMKAGMKAGREKEKYEIIKAMLKDHQDHELIKKYTGVSVEKLRTIEKSLIKE